jgi:hypothetical protein
MSAPSKRDGEMPKRPGQSPGSDAVRRAREGRRAAELRANLKRRKEDLARRGGAAQGSDEPEA